MSRNDTEHGRLGAPLPAFLDLAAPLLLGLAAFLLVVGPAPLQVGNIAWLAGSDPAQHYLGWAFYRQSPWSFPLGSNPGYGMELGSSIFYSDSIPLMAIFFKLLAPLLPATFQYVGLWLLACFLLQGWFAWRLVGLVSKDPALRALGTGFFLFSPPMLWLLNGHDALFGHWLVLAALCLCLDLSLRRRTLAWGALALVAALVHAYLLAMVLGLWLSDLARRLITRETSLLSLAAETGGVLAAAGGALWQAGFFLVSSGHGGKGGFGYYSLNVLALVNPAASGFKEKDQWSYLLPGLPHLEGTGDLLFLGSGVLLLLLLALPCLARAVRAIHLWPNWVPLGAVMAGMTLFALSNNIAIGTFEFSVPLPERLLAAGQLLRCSARLFWPVYYLIYGALLFVVIRYYGRQKALVMLSSLLLLQVADTSRGWLPIRESRPPAASTWPTPFKSPVWKAAAQHYRKIRVIPPGEHPRYADIAFFAATHGLQTDAAYLARYDGQKLADARSGAEASIATGAYDATAFYLLGDAEAAAAQKHLRADQDRIFRLDGFTVIAPGWRSVSVPEQLKLDEMAGNGARGSQPAP